MSGPDHSPLPLVAVLLGPEESLSPAQVAGAADGVARLLFVLDSSDTSEAAAVLRTVREQDDGRRHGVVGLALQGDSIARTTIDVATRRMDSFLAPGFINRHGPGALTIHGADFIYAVVGEELGLIGTGGVLLGFLVILWRGMRSTLRLTDDFGRYLALGITTCVVVQGLINMSVVLGMVPTKGIPLPMISSGGSSLLCTLASLGVLLNVSEHAG